MVSKTPRKKAEKNHFGSEAVTLEQLSIIGNLLDTKLEEKLARFKLPVYVNIPKTEVNLMYPSKYFNWKDFVWASALGIIVGFVISKM